MQLFVTLGSLGVIDDETRTQLYSQATNLIEFLSTKRPWHP